MTITTSVKRLVECFNDGEIMVLVIPYVDQNIREFLSGGSNMVSLEQLKELCKPPSEGKAYYRPMLCNGDLDKVEIFFVGTNPATPIFPEDMNLDSYVNLLFNYDEFLKYYKSLRLANGKDGISRTRIGMGAFLNWLTKQTSASIVEIEVIPYPTEKLKQLKKEPLTVIERGKEIFFELVMQFQPNMIILHGKTTVEHVVDIFERNGLLPNGVVDTDQSIEDMEYSSPISTVIYPGGKIGTIMACRHFMYYGITGDSFGEFRKKVVANL